MSNITKLELIDRRIQDDDNIFKQIEVYANTLKEVLINNLAIS
jgi:hypothetical protein